MPQEFRAMRRAGPAAAFSLALALMAACGAPAEPGPEPDRALVTIPTPRAANLLQLRGIGGHGSALFRVEGACYSMPVRLVAGDFEGRQANMRAQDPIVLELRDPRLVQALLNGRDIVSAELSVSADPRDQGASILLLSGIAEGTGFVINPGRSLVADIFGARVSDMPCGAFAPAATAEPEG
ncbi:hypothetical protein [Dinoroseobacter sp. S76]|uniref:hypothetical protein n=1 Tax=Dinoroseobacter sp. S76 TaxID=3415124 RepID=UPI003C7CA1CB